MELIVEGVVGGAIVGLIIGWIIAAVQGQGSMTIFENLLLYVQTTAIGALIGGVLGIIICIISVVLG